MSSLDDRIAALEEHLVALTPEELVEQAEQLHAAGQDDAARLALATAKHAAALEVSRGHSGHTFGSEGFGSTEHDEDDSA